MAFFWYRELTAVVRLFLTAGPAVVPGFGALTSVG
jgi:hypothetical protein